MGNENRPGHKKTKAGLIPEEWEYIPLRKVAQQPFINGIFKPPNEHGSGTLLINVIDTYKRIIVDVDQLNRVYTTSAELMKYGNRHGDLFFVRSSLKLEGVGNCCVLLDDETPSIFECHLIRYRPDLSKVDPLFAAYLCRSPNIRKQLLSFAQTTTMSTIPQGYLEGCMLPLPPIPEQKKIAEILSTWDDAIEQTQKLIEAKKHRRKTLIRQLLTGRIRFQEFGKPSKKNDELPTDWQILKLCNLFTPISRKNDKGSKKILTASGEFGLIDQEIFFNHFIGGQNLENYYLLKNGEFAYNRSSMKNYPYGAIKRLDKYDEGILSTLYICFSLANDCCDSDFYKHIFESGILNKELRSITQVGARAHGLLNVTIKDFFSIRIPIPHIEEQRKIATIINNCDKEIEILCKKETALRNMKKGLMQKLLTAEIRVKT